MAQHPSSFTKRIDKLAKNMNAAARQYGQSRVTIGLRLLSLYWHRGFRPGEALEIGLANPMIAQEALRACFTKSELMALQNELNPRELISITEDKSVFASYCSARGIPAPTYFATLGRKTAEIPDGSSLTTRESWLGDIAPQLPPAFITKPALGVYGEGVKIWKREGPVFRDHKQRLYSAEALYEQCCSDPKYDRYVVQSRLINHRSLVELTGSSSLQTVRVVTLIDGDGKARCLYAEWKLVVGDNVTDNFSAGRSGNLAASVALADGSVGPAQAAASNGIGFRQFQFHPDTGAPVAGFRLPNWNLVIELALSAAKLFLPLRTIGWDIGITPDGPVIVEGNRWWDPPNDAVIGPPAPGLALHELITNGPMLRAAALQGAQ
jgi:hypothetical protein